jgi:hypothetical protein
MTVFSGSGSLPAHQYVFVDSSFVRRERTGFEPCAWFGLHSKPGRAWGCHVMLECGAFYRDLPPHALAFRADPAPWSLEEAQRWDCYGASFGLHAYPYLSGLSCLARAGKGETQARYLFTAVPIGDAFSEHPEQAKEFLFLATAGGRLTIQPTDKVLFLDASFTTGAEWPQDLKAQTEVYSAERGEGRGAAAEIAPAAAAPLERPPASARDRRPRA